MTSQYQLIDAKEVMRLTGLRDTAARTLMDQLGKIRFGKSVRIRRIDLERHIKAQVKRCGFITETEPGTSRPTTTSPAAKSGSESAEARGSEQTVEKVGAPPNQSPELKLLISHAQAAKKKNRLRSQTRLSTSGFPSVGPAAQPQPSKSSTKRPSSSTESSEVEPC